jgi:hypothetical protein
MHRSKEQFFSLLLIEIKLETHEATIFLFYRFRLLHVHCIKETKLFFYGTGRVSPTEFY